MDSRHRARQDRTERRERHNRHEQHERVERLLRHERQERQHTSSPSSSSRRARSSSRPRLPPSSSGSSKTSHAPSPSSGSSHRSRSENRNPNSERGTRNSAPVKRTPRSKPLHPHSNSISEASEQPAAVDNSWTAWWGGVMGSLNIQKAASTGSSPTTHPSNPSASATNPVEETVWTGMWNKVKDAAQAITGPKEDEEVNSALREYYSKKGGDVPEFLKPQSNSRPDDASLNKFDQIHRKSPRPVRTRRREGVTHEA